MIRIDNTLHAKINDDTAINWWIYRITKTLVITWPNFNLVFQSFNIFVLYAYLELKFFKWPNNGLISGKKYINYEWPNRLIVLVNGLVIK